MFAGSSYNVCVCCESSVRQHWLCLRFPLSFLSKVPWNYSWKVGFSAGFAGGLSGSCAECVATVVVVFSRKVFAEGFVYRAVRFLAICKMIFRI